MKRLYSLLLLLLTVSGINTATASHVMGGEISYTWISGTTYELQLTYYRDCQGINAPATISISASSTCYPTPLTIVATASANSPQQVSPICASVQSNCNGGQFNGIEKWEYVGNITLPGNCSDWIFSYTECCRNGAITNLNQPFSQSSYFWAQLNNFDTPFNNSATFAGNPVPYLTAGAPVQINNGAFDADNDSIVVSLSAALGNGGVPLTYAGFATPTNPITTLSGITIDPSTGNVSLTPSAPEVDVIVYRIDEYRNGILIGSSTRDFQVNVITYTNALPTLSGINGSASYLNTVCAGDTLGFTLYSDDADANDSTTIDILSTGLGSVVSATYFGGQKDSVYIELIADGSLISPLAHTLYIRVSDNKCPYIGTQTYAYQIYVNGCSADVWPGDANNDLSCNLYDILPIGLGYNASGPVRTNASLVWVAQPSTDWSSSFASGNNYKFADCNGDGIIDSNDTLAIAQNYGLTHPVRLANSTNQQNSLANMYLISSTDTAGPNSTVQVDIRLGDVSAPARRIYGIAFKLAFNPTIIDPSASSLQFSGSQLGTPGADLMTFVRPDWTNGIIDAVAVRMDGNEQTVDSTIALFDVVIVDNVSARTTLSFDLLGVRAIDAGGIAKFFSIINDSVSVNSGTTGIRNPFIDVVSVYPNPANETLRISGATAIRQIVVRDLNGKIISSTDASWSGTSIDIQSLSEGVYFAEITADGNVYRKKFSVIR